MRNYVVEFIGTFFLVLVIGLTVVTPEAAVAAPDCDVSERQSSPDGHDARHPALFAQ